MTIREIVRDDSLPVPGTSATPAWAGPATSIGLDLLCCLPALLVIARRALDGDFVLRHSRSHTPMLLLAGWTVLSAAWSSDKFLALVNASHWAAALVLLWSTSQLVHSWLRLRVVAAVALGLLMVLLVQGYYYRFVELPDFQSSWRDNPTELLRQRGSSANTIEAEQLGKNILGGAPTGFNVSRNTYAALLVLLVLVASGIAVQRMRDGDAWGWIIPVFVATDLTLFMLYRYVQSKTAYATPLIGAMLLGALWARRRWIASHARRMYWIAVGACCLMAAAVVGHGLKHGTLPHVSLTFRWWYWVGAARVFAHYPWLGVGWGNFGAHYVAYRLPQAAEDPADPHNFLVRAFVELGIVGGVLTLAWMLRFWWDMAVGGLPDSLVEGASQVRSETSVRGASRATYPAMPFVLGVSIMAMGLNSAVSIDWSLPAADPAHGSAWIIIEIFKRFMFLVALCFGMALAAMRSFADQRLDDRPARWIWAALAVALALFLLHNLIDFSLFETGPMFLFALLAGAALGCRLPPAAPARRGRGIATIACALGTAALLGAAGFVWFPIARAEDLAHDADEQIRTSGPGLTAGPNGMSSAALDAAVSLRQAFDWVPYNGDYAFRAEQAAFRSRENPVAAWKLIDKAIAADPTRIRYRVARATLDEMAGDFTGAVAEYERILKLDPTDLDLRLQYAQLLDRAGRREAARVEYQRILELNGKRLPDEIRQLTPQQVQQIRGRIG